MDRPPNTASFDCAYCGSNIVATETTTRLIKPKSLLPFHITRKDARERFGRWLRSRWFAPNALKRYARMEHKLEGVYVPYWTYDSDTTSTYSGQRGDDYWVTRGSGKNKRRVRKTRWRYVRGTIRERFDDLLVLESRSLPRKYVQRLEPWDLDALVPYQDDYLAGLRAETYQVTLPEGFDEARAAMEQTIRVLVRRDIGGDHQRILSLDIRHDEISFKHLLLPMWISAYRFRDKAYRILVNARTGEVQGERPWSVWKIALAVLAAVVVGVAAYFLFGQ
jgi:hypothetical protein